MPQHGVACQGTVCLTLMLVFWVLPAVTAAAPRGRALLTGNAAYQEGRLLNPVNDARAMAEMLRQFDFEVTLVEDANLEKMEAAVGNFSSKPGQSGSVGLFYFSGHGLQIDNQNYLVPVGVRLESPADVRHRTLKEDWVLDKLTEAGHRLNIIILDACRNNPYVLGAKSTTKGLARMQEPADSLVAYATAPGMLADDNPAGRTRDLPPW